MRHLDCLESFAEMYALFDGAYRRNAMHVIANEGRSAACIDGVVLFEERTLDVLRQRCWLSRCPSACSLMRSAT